MRATLSPAFTGSKMRQMMKFVVETTSNGVNSFKLQMGDDNEKGILEMKEFFSKFTVDTIASCAFGLNVDTFKYPENEFKIIANKTMNPDGILLVFKFILLYFFPKFMKKLDISILDRQTKAFFRQTVSETMEYREKNGIVRPDMIHLLQQTKKEKLTHEQDEEKNVESLAAVDESEVGKNKVLTEWKTDELVAQCLLFFLAGLLIFRNNLRHLA